MKDDEFADPAWLTTFIMDAMDFIDDHRWLAGGIFFALLLICMALAS
jgi:hypothetical protein